MESLFRNVFDMSACLETGNMSLNLVKQLKPNIINSRVKAFSQSYYLNIHSVIWIRPRLVIAVSQDVLTSHGNASSWQLTSFLQRQDPHCWDVVHGAMYHRNPSVRESQNLIFCPSTLSIHDKPWSKHMSNECPGKTIFFFQI